MGHDQAGTIPGVVQVQVAPATLASPEDRAFRQSVVAAVHQLNENSYPGEGREVTYSIDPQSRKPVAKLVETGTGEVIAQWPGERVLALAAENRKNQNLA